jgi:phosphatidylglycerophosphate synthase
MLTLPNAISLCRIPLAFLFLNENLTLRVVVLFLALLSDGLDGWIARRTSKVSQLGTLIDPLTDKFFVLMALSVFFNKGDITLSQAACFICRDFSVLIFGFYLMARGLFTSYELRAIWCGKVTTFFQFMVLLALSLEYKVATSVYTLFLVLGVMALVELKLSFYFQKNKTIKSS